MTETMIAPDWRHKAFQFTNKISEYKIVIPETIINEMGWYEETVIQWSIDDKDVILKDADE